MKPFTKFAAACCLLFLSAFSLYSQSFDLVSVPGPKGLATASKLAVDHTGRLFLYSVVDGILTSDDQGNTWQLCLGNLPSNYYSAQFVPSNTGELFLSFGNATSVFRYDEPSITWKAIQISQWLGGSYDGFDIDRNGRFWFSADASLSTLFYSDNQGQTLTELPVNGQITGGYDQLATYNDDHNLIAVSYGVQQKVYHFTKNGNIQQVLVDSPMSYLGYNPYTGTAFFSSYQSTKRSTDGGLTWTKINMTQPGLGPFDKLIFEPGGRIWGQDSGTLYYSDDDGLTWAQDIIQNGVHGTYTLGPDNNWYLISNCDYPNLGHSSDGRQTWTDLSQHFSHQGYSEWQQDAAGSLYAHTCKRNYCEKSADGGQTWSDLIIQDSVDQFVTSAATRSDGLILAATSIGRLYRSFDNGSHWERLTLPVISGLSQINLFRGYNGEFYIKDILGFFRSTDDGNSWTGVSFATFSNSIAIHPNGDIYAADGSSLQVYQTSTDSTFYLELGSFESNNVHCTSNGVTYLTGSLDFSARRFLRMLPNGQYTPEPIPFFDNLDFGAMTSNAEGDIFVSTPGHIYKSDDLGATWESVCTYPTAWYVRNLYVTFDQYLYLDCFPNGTYRSKTPISERNYITGRIWLDLDGNCSYDPGEELKSNFGVNVVGSGNYVSFSGYNGRYIVSVPPGNYTPKLIVPNALFEACQPAAPVVVTGPNDTLSVDVPVRAAIQCPYLSVNVSTALLRRCFDAQYLVHYKNNGTATASGAFITLDLDQYLIFQSASIPVSLQNGQQLTFQLGDLAPGEEGSFHVIVKVSCDAALGQEHCVSASIFPNDLCVPTLAQLAYDRECRQNIGSFDPNDKQVFANGEENAPWAEANTDLEYLIRFQNTGTDTAFRVVVADRFSELLDLTTFTPLVSSHPYRIETVDQQTLRFVFDNILLPDSNINEVASHGFLKFRISQKPNLPVGSIVKNKADIYFDFNAPVTTNETSITIGFVSVKPEPESAFDVKAWPNPFTDEIRFEVTGQQVPRSLHWRLFDTMGRQVRSEAPGSPAFTVKRKGLPAGLYHFLIESEGRRIGSGTIQAR